MILFKDMNFISHTSELKNKTCMQYYILTKTSTAQSIIYEYANSTHMAYITVYIYGTRNLPFGSVSR